SSASSTALGTFDELNGYETATTGEYARAASGCQLLSLGCRRASGPNLDGAEVGAAADARQVRPGRPPNRTFPADTISPSPPRTGATRPKPAPPNSRRNRARIPAPSRTTSRTGNPTGNPGPGRGAPPTGCAPCTRRPPAGWSSTA